MRDASLSVQWFNRISPGKPVACSKMDVSMDVFVRLVEPAVSAAGYPDSGLGFEQWFAVVV
jgi:hypothetical protein